MKAFQESEAILAAGKSLVEVQQKLEFSEATWMRWKKQYGSMRSDEAKRLRELELENRRLKEKLAKAGLEERILKETIEGNY